jgi:hypothetical protein
MLIAFFLRALQNPSLFRKIAILIEQRDWRSIPHFFHSDHMIAV